MVSTNIPFSGLGLLLSSALALMLPLVSFSISSISLLYAGPDSYSPHLMLTPCCFCLAEIGGDLLVQENTAFPVLGQLNGGGDIIFFPFLSKVNTIVLFCCLAKQQACHSERVLFFHH